MHIVHSTFTNALGGTERHIAELANVQVEQGHRVTVMLRVDRNPYDGHDSMLDWFSPPIEVVRVPRRWPLIPLYFKLRQLKPDIIHTHHGRDSRYLSLAAPKDTPVIGTLHMRYRTKDYKRHDGVICVANWQNPHIRADKHELIRVIPNWVQSSVAPDDATLKALRQQWNIPEDAKILGCVARLVDHKGVDVLIEAFHHAKLENTYLIVLGDGEDKPDLQKQIARYQNPRVILCGYQENIRPYFYLFDGFVMPSRTETFGLVFLEAMDAGCPILATKTQGAWEILGGNEQVFWCSPEDIDGLKHGLQRFSVELNTRWNYPELERHRLPQAAEQVMECYEKLLNES
jgi:glycosyltransferase involved in cell wall biosynthesis